MTMQPQSLAPIWTALDRGKHAGKTLPQVLFADPDWFFWAVEQQIFRWFLAIDAAKLNRRARAIRIPDPAGVGLVAEYALERDGRFAGLKIVPGQHQPDGFARVLRRDVIDLSIPRRLSNYDKGGYRIMLADIKELLFGNRGARMTKERCESFYGNPENFADVNG